MPKKCHSSTQKSKPRPGACLEEASVDQWETRFELADPWLVQTYFFKVSSGPGLWLLWSTMQLFRLIYTGCPQKWLKTTGCPKSTQPNAHWPSCLSAIQSVLQLLSLLTCLQVIEFCQDCVYIVEKNFENIYNLHTLVVKHDQRAHVGHQVLPTCTRWLSSITNVHKLVKFLSNLTVNFTYKVKFRSKIFCQLRSTCTRWSRSTCVSSIFINYFFGKNTRY